MCLHMYDTTETLYGGCSVHVSLSDTGTVWAGVLYLGHKQGAGVDDVYEVSQTAEEGALQEATLKLRSRVYVSVCPDTTKQEGRRPSESVVSRWNIFNGSLFNLPDVMFYNSAEFVPHVHLRKSLL